MLDVEATFCYLGDMLCSGGACDSAIAARCCVARGKFRKLLPVLTTRHLSPRICDKVFEACVRSAISWKTAKRVQSFPECWWLFFCEVQVKFWAQFGNDPVVFLQTFLQWWLQNIDGEVIPYFSVHFRSNHLFCRRFLHIVWLGMWKLHMLVLWGYYQEGQGN